MLCRWRLGLSLTEPDQTKEKTSWSNPLPLSFVTLQGTDKAKQVKHMLKCSLEWRLKTSVTENSWGYQTLLFVSLVDGDAVKYLDKSKYLGGLTWVNTAFNRT